MVSNAMKIISVIIQYSVKSKIWVMEAWIMRSFEILLDK